MMLVGIRVVFAIAVSNGFDLLNLASTMGMFAPGRQLHSLHQMHAFALLMLTTYACASVCVCDVALILGWAWLTAGSTTTKAYLLPTLDSSRIQHTVSSFAFMNRTDPPVVKWFADSIAYTAAHNLTYVIKDLAP